MNLKYFIIQSIAFSIICISCESHEQKADEAFKNYKVKNVSEIDSSSIFKDSINTLLKIVNAKKVIKIESSNNFRKDLEKKVKVNNLLITHLKEQHQSTSKEFRKMLRLEETNNLFITKLNDFEENMDKELNDMNISMKRYETKK